MHLELHGATFWSALARSVAKSFQSSTPEVKRCAHAAPRKAFVMIVKAVSSMSGCLHEWEHQRRGFAWLRHSNAMSLKLNSTKRCAVLPDAITSPRGGAAASGDDEVGSEI